MLLSLAIPRRRARPRNNQFSRRSGAVIAESGGHPNKQRPPDGASIDYEVTNANQ